MRNYILFIVFISVIPVYGQTRSTEGWTNFGSNHTSQWLQIAPGKMGPNALPVPEMDYARVDSFSKVEIGVHSHTMKGDTAINSYLSFQWTIVPKKVAVKIWGIPTETFRLNNELRDERQIYYDDTGWRIIGGDLWVSTFIQVLKDRKYLPDLVLNYTLKTTTGMVHDARYTDAPLNYFYMALGKSYLPKKSFIDEIRLAALGGFYVWQTNKVEMAQDEGPVFEVGLKIRHKNFWLVNEFGGYRGYDAYSFIGALGFNDPLIYRLSGIKQGKIIDWKIEYNTGWQDYNYNTFKFEVAYRFNFNY
jgi:hypothetical protein